jgi:pimeloyl-ACP methyl ester carboxylesterase
VTVVAHSMGGAVLTRAGQLAPELIAHAVYLAAFMPASGVPSAAYPRMPENEGSRVGALRVGDARAPGRCAWTSRRRTRRTGRPCARRSTATSIRSPPTRQSRC